MKKVICILLLIVLLSVLGFSVWQILDITTEYEAGSDSYEVLDQYVDMPQLEVWEDEPREETKATGDGDTPTEQAAPEETTAAVKKAPTWPKVDFDGLSQVNDDIVAWLYVPGTVINYPIVQTGDNDYYLNHLFNGKVNSSGCIFLDYSAAGDFTSMNSVLHGHHMRNGTMFAAVCKYKNPSFYRSHPTAMLVTPEGNYEVRFFSGYVCDTESDAWNYSFSDGDYDTWLKKRLKLSCFKSGVTPSAEDRVLTLSTCSYEFDDARFVLHGILVKV